MPACGGWNHTYSLETQTSGVQCSRLPFLQSGQVLCESNCERDLFFSLFCSDHRCWLVRCRWQTSLPAMTAQKWFRLSCFGRMQQDKQEGHIQKCVFLSEQPNCCTSAPTTVSSEVVRLGFEQFLGRFLSFYFANKSYLPWRTHGSRRKLYSPTVHTLATMSSLLQGGLSSCRLLTADINSSPHDDFNTDLLPLDDDFTASSKHPFHPTSPAQIPVVL